MKDGKKSVLILTGPMGAGHLRAAMAIRQAFEKNHPECHVDFIDTTRWMPYSLRWMFLGLYPFILRFCPWFWGLVHARNNKGQDGFFTKIQSRLGGGFKKRLLKFMEDQGTDLLVCTHFFPIRMVAEMKKDGACKIPMAAVVTDYFPHRIYAYDTVDRFFTFNNESLERLVSWGMDRKRIRIVGCPIFPKYAIQDPENHKEEFCHDLGLDPNKDYCMLTMGGWAISDIEDDISKWLDESSDACLLVMTGINRRLARRLRKLDAGRGRVISVNFTDSMEKFMAISEVVVTKPGGLTTSECFAMGKPMLLTRPIAGHEEENMEYLVKNGLALAPEEGERMSEAACRVWEMRDTLRERSREMGERNAVAAVRIADLSLEMTSEA